MLDRLARWIVRFRPKIIFIVKAIGGALLLVTAFFLCELYFFPWMTGSNWAKKWGLLPSLSDRTTIVERRETVTVTQDENLERLATEHGSIVVRLTPQFLPGQNITAPNLFSRGFLGTLITNDGFIVTYTAISPQTESSYFVWFNDGTKDRATFVGYDTLTQLAYYRVDRNNTAAAALTNSDDIKPGRRVALLGLTQDFRPSIYSSIIEQRDQFFNLSPQTVASSEKWEGVLKLTMLSQEGYLGGPALLNNGEVAGIVGNRILDGKADFFLIPARVLRESLDRLVTGKVDRPTVGVYYLSLNQERAEHLALPRSQGALVYSPSGRTGLAVLAGSSAARAGLLYGDIITHVNGELVTSEHPFSTMMGAFHPGDQVQLTILRDGTERNIDLSL
jgi:S1-C subfamily serine protease